MKRLDEADAEARRREAREILVKTSNLLVYVRFFCLIAWLFVVIAEVSFIEELKLVTRTVTSNQCSGARASWTRILPSTSKEIIKNFDFC
jgi:hypothetical protein